MGGVNIDITEACSVMHEPLLKPGYLGIASEGLPKLVQEAVELLEMDYVKEKIKQSTYVTGVGASQKIAQALSGEIGWTVNFGSQNTANEGAEPFMSNGCF